MKKEIIEKLSVLITSAFGLVAALAWNNTVQTIFKKVFGTTEGIVPTLIYAVVVTIIAVIMVVWVGKISARLK